ncbi:hypothetical protein Peur_056565 [Populus x canadensis]
MATVAEDSVINVAALSGSLRKASYNEVPPHHTSWQRPRKLLLSRLGKATQAPINFYSPLVKEENFIRRIRIKGRKKNDFYICKIR